MDSPTPTPTPTPTTLLELLVTLLTTLIPPLSPYLSHSTISHSVSDMLPLAITLVIIMNVIGFVVTVAISSESLTDLVGTGVIGVSAYFMYSQVAQPTPAATLASFLFIGWSFRLSLFLFYRALLVGDARLKKYLRKEGEGFFDKSASNFPVKLAKFWCVQSVWGVLLLLPYAFTLFPMESVDAESAHLSLFHVAAYLLASCGLLLESIADWQKWMFKRVYPDGVCMNGLYSYVQYPNYTGEILFQTGITLGALFSQAPGLRWVLSLLGPTITVLLLLFVSGIPLSERRRKKYDNVKEFQAYRQSTPLLFPFFTPKSKLSKRDWIASE